MEFNNVLDTMLKAAGPMTIATSPLPDTLPAALKRNRNFNWITDSIFRKDVADKLDTIKTNFRPHPICWVQNNTYTTNYGGWLVFPYDSLMLITNTYSNYPDEAHRLLVLFKHWNIINYFDPYTYVFDKPMDSILWSVEIPIASAQDDNSFYLAIKKMTSQFDDAHVEGGTYSYDLTFPYRGYYFPEIVLDYADNKYIVAKSGIPGIYSGDALVSIDGLTTSQWEDSLKNYISAGNISVFHRFMYYYLTGGPYGSVAEIKVLDSSGNTKTINSRRLDYLSDGWFPAYGYPVDSLNSVKWTTIGCNIGYVNMGNLTTSDVNNMYSELMNKSAIIFDLRNYPNSTEGQIADLMYPNYTVFAKFSIPDVTYPGTFFWDNDGLGYNNNPNPYNGKVFILMNEQTQSQAEFSCMILGAIPNAIKIGSQTAGTDGNVTPFRISQDIYSAFTTLGTYYPNGDSTERIGIVPDLEVLPTQKGIRHGDDEVLDKALALACQAGINQTKQILPSIKIYPNPSNQSFYISSQGTGINDFLDVSMTDMTGNIVLQESIANNLDNNTARIDISSISPGMYFVTVTNKMQTETVKIIKQ